MIFAHTLSRDSAAACHHFWFFWTGYDGSGCAAGSTVQQNGNLVIGGVELGEERGREVFVRILMQSHVHAKAFCVLVW